MRCLVQCRSLRLWGVLVAVVAVSGCGQDSDSGPTPRFAVLSAFPAELAPNLERAAVSETTVIEGRVFRLGMLGGVPVVLGLTGIGLVNAATTTRALLERFDIRGVVVSAVANSPLQIGDVTVPAAWETMDGTTYAAHPQWIEFADAIAAPGTVSLERCTVVPSASQEPVCLPQGPVIVVGGVGKSSGTFGGAPFPCQPDGGDLYGCDVVSTGFASAAAVRRHVLATLATAAETPVANDMETAGIAREAVARGVPFIAFRAVSDGAGDPLGLPGSLAQFAAYYHLAARNASAATVAFLERIAAIEGGNGIPP